MGQSISKSSDVFNSTAARLGIGKKGKDEKKPSRRDTQFQMFEDSSEASTASTSKTSDFQTSDQQHTRPSDDNTRMPGQYFDEPRVRQIIREEVNMMGERMAERILDHLRVDSTRQIVQNNPPNPRSFALAHSTPHPGLRGKTPSQALVWLHQEQFTNNRPVDDYIDDMVFCGTFGGYALETTLTIAWFNLDDPIREHVPRPVRDVDEFRRNVDKAAKYCRRKLLEPYASEA